MRERKVNIINLSVYIVFICTYMLPTGFLDLKFDLSKIVFTLSFLLFWIAGWSKSNVKIGELLSVFLIFLLFFYTSNINYLTFITILYLSKIINHSEDIKKKIIKGNILYICLFFTILYSILSVFYVSIPIGSMPRYARTGIVEPNQSAFSIFMLGIMLLKKNKKVGIFTLLFGILTFSRLYYLSLLIYVLSKTKIYKLILSKINEKKLSYAKLNFISLFILIIIGYFYLYLYHNNKILPDNLIGSHLNLFDYSNLHRFTVNIMLLYMIFMNPKYILFGIEEAEFLNKCIDLSANYFNVHYSGNIPHNLFLSHLKIYGFFAVLEVFITSKYLKQITNKNNIIIFLIVFLTSIILGCGLYSYWLYISFFTMIIYKINDDLEFE